jgi:hypothetical protein
MRQERYLIVFYVKVESSGSSSLAQGSDPLPGESEAQYVARQRALQDEVRHVVQRCDDAM